MSPKNRGRAYAGLILASLILVCVVLEGTRSQWFPKYLSITAMLGLAVILLVVMPRLRPQQ